MIIIKAKRNYKSLLDISLYFVPVFIIIFLITYFQKEPLINALYACIFAYGLAMGMILIFFFTTSYSLDQQYFKYQSGFIFGKIDISNIHKLELNKTRYVGMKPATSKNGIIVHYNKYDEIYISPQDNEELANALKAINPNIEIVTH